MNASTHAKTIHSVAAGETCLQTRRLRINQVSDQLIYTNRLHQTTSQTEMRPHENYEGSLRRNLIGAQTRTKALQYQRCCRQGGRGPGSLNIKGSNRVHSGCALFALSANSANAQGVKSGLANITTTHLTQPTQMPD